MLKKENCCLIALASVPLVMTLGNSMLIPILPTLEKKLHISSFQVSMIITIYSIVAIVLIPIAGYLSDRWGRKMVMVPSLLIAAIGGAITGWVSWKVENPYVWILIGRAIQGIGAAGAMPVVIPCVGDLYKDEKQVSTGLGIIETSNTFGKVLSPILGSALAAVVWFLPFWAIPVLCAVAIILLLLLVKAKKQENQAPPFKEFIQSIGSTFQEKGRWLVAIFALGAIIMLILFGILFYLSTILEEKYNIHGIWKGCILAIPLLVLSISSYMAGKKIGDDQDVMKKCIYIGFILAAASVILPLFLKGIYLLILCLVVMGMGIGIALPCLDALITQGIEKEQRGTVTSFYSSMRFTGVAAGPPLYAYFMKGTDHEVFYLTCIFAVAGAIITIVWIKPKKNNKPLNSVPEPTS
ncbi:MULTISPECIES: MFS transporter [Bacillus]|nr:MULTISPECIES: MFS transporter [Bacillus]AIK38045.1 bacillibactin exporter [Bacillus pseudomycoides]AJI17632.1 bacillibactin exporter [Bacillus pseudomycoides]EEM05815.1 Multidrug resistance protein [Bacillus pseudomycoides]EEM11641.1 Multidrug resistance protein [Bacillus pseudomycoides]EEM17293.1 Multidrug resistance protein [Bacillus pseudomycoides DSM 12442]